MRRETAVLVLLALAACHSNDAKRAEESVAARLHTDVAWLADDAREGRRAGSDQGLVAGNWIADRLRELDLEPAGDAGRFTQAFTVPLEPRSAGKSAFGAADGAAVAEAPAHLAPLFCSSSGSVSAPVVYCGYGIELARAAVLDDAGTELQSALAWDDFAGRDVSGKIALVLRGSPHAPGTAMSASGTATGTASGTAENTSVNPHGSNAGAAASGTPANPHGDMGIVAAGDPFVNAGLVFTKVMNAKRKGAAAVVLVQHPSDAGQPVLAFYEGGSGRAGIPCITISWKDAEKVFGGALATWTSDLESAPAPARGASSAGRSYTLSADVERGHGEAVNVLARIPGVDRSRVVVLGAHYDHLGFGGTGSLAPNERAVHNGADDNASGTAAVLEIARELRDGPQPACDVLVALWSGEELGLLGSEWWADHPTVPFDRIVGNVNLDMVGRAGNGKLQVLGAGSAAGFADWLAQAGPAADLDLTVNASSSAMAGSSDHATFAKRKKPVLHLFSGLHTDYHKPTDDVEKFEADGAARVVTLGIDLVRRMCAAPSLAFVEPPPAPEGERKVQSGFSAWFGSVPNYAFEGPGVRIDGTSSGSPAERAGFLAGDTILAVGEVEIGTIYDFTYALQHYKPGDVVLVVFERDGEREETRVTLSSRGLR